MSLTRTIADSTLPIYFFSKAGYRIVSFESRSLAWRSRTSGQPEQAPTDHHQAKTGAISNSALVQSFTISAEKERGPRSPREGVALVRRNPRKSICLLRISGSVTDVLGRARLSKPIAGVPPMVEAYRGPGKFP